MPFLIHADDFDGMNEARENNREAHRAHLEAKGDKILAAGAILADDGETVVGGLTILDTDDREEAETFAATDPYTTAGIRKETTVTRWRKRWWEGDFLG